MGAGVRVDEIAHELALSPKTVRTYRSRILEKTGIRSTAELIFYAVQNGLVGQASTGDQPSGHTPAVRGENLPTASRARRGTRGR